MKRIVCIILACALCAAAAFSCAAWDNPFTDVKEKNWFYNAVKYASENGIVKGMSETEFAPNIPITRGMFVTVLGRFAGADDKGSSSAFSDVKKSAYYAPYVAWAYENGIVNGTGAGLFAPGEPIKRQDMCVILHRFSVFSGIILTFVKDEYKFADEKKIRSYALPSVVALQRAGIVEGTGVNFEPDGISTRAQAAAVLMRLAALRDSQAVTDKITDPHTGITVEYTSASGITHSSALTVTRNAQDEVFFSDELSSVRSYKINIEPYTAHEELTVMLPADISDADCYRVYTGDQTPAENEYSFRDGYICIKTKSLPINIIYGKSFWTDNY